MRIAKSGSTSVLHAVEEAKKDQSACWPIQPHFHDYTAVELCPTCLSFAILREPCERFVSQAFHLKQRLRLPALQDPETFASALLHDGQLRHDFLYHGSTEAEL